VKQRALLVLAVATVFGVLGPGAAMARNSNADEQTPEHCDETDQVDPSAGNGNDRCPENPPCDADHGMPALHADDRCEEADTDTDTDTDTETDTDSDTKTTKDTGTETETKKENKN
jgi:hypothetical protein